MATIQWATRQAGRVSPLLIGLAQFAHALQAAPTTVGKKRKDPTILRSKPGSSKRIRADQQAPPANGKAAKPPAKPPAKPSKGRHVDLGLVRVLPVP